MQRKRAQKIALAAIMMSALLLAVLPFYSVRFSDSRTDCLPYKLWLIDKTDKSLAVGDFIVFRTPPTVVGEDGLCSGGGEGGSSPRPARREGRGALQRREPDAAGGRQCDGASRGPREDARSVCGRQQGEGPGDGAIPGYHAWPVFRLRAR